MDNPFVLLEQHLIKIENQLQELLAKENKFAIENDQLGGIELAIEITKLKQSTIYSHVSKRKIPFTKKNGKLYFSKKELGDWIKPNNEALDEKSKAFFPYYKKLKRAI